MQGQCTIWNTSCMAIPWRKQKNKMEGFITWLKEKYGVVDSTTTDTAGIYLFFNKTTEKRYIGKSVNVKKRIRQHKGLLGRNQHYRFKNPQGAIVEGLNTKQLCLENNLNRTSNSDCSRTQRVWRPSGRPRCIR